MRPPGVDIGAHGVAGTVLVIQVKLDRAAATGLGRDHGLDACGVKHARGGAVDIGRHGRLHTAREHQHLARMHRHGCDPRILRCGHLGAKGLRQHAAHRLTQLHGHAKQGRGQALFERPAQRPLGQGARHFGVHQLAAQVDQMAVFHAAGAGGFAVAAGQAAVQVLLGFAGGLGAFQHLLDQINAPARAVQLVAQQLVGGAGGSAKAAVHAVAHNGLGGLAVGRVLVLRRKRDLHGRCQLLRLKPRSAGGAC